MTTSNYNTGFPNGVTIRNVPIVDLQNGNGKVFMVDSTIGSDSHKGTFRYPFASIRRALTFCVAGRGDKILVATGHEEVIDDDSYDIAVENVQIFGLGVGKERPRLELSGIAANHLKILRSNIYMGNIIVDINNSAAPTYALLIDSPGVILENCSFMVTGTAPTSVVALQTISSIDNVSLINCDFYINGSSNGIYIPYSGDNITIQDCSMFGTFANACIYNTAALTNLRLIRGSYSNFTATKAAVSVHASTTGIAEDVRMNSDSLTTVFSAGSLRCNGCLGTAAAATAGTAIP